MNWHMMLWSLFLSFSVCLRVIYLCFSLWASMLSFIWNELWYGVRSNLYIISGETGLPEELSFSAWVYYSNYLGPDRLPDNPHKAASLARFYLVRLSHIPSWQDWLRFKELMDRKYFRQIGFYSCLSFLSYKVFWYLMTSRGLGQRGR